MILGTCNMNQKYNGYQIPKKEVFRILETFEKLGGELLDTGLNYNNHSLLMEYIKGGSDLKIQTKVWNSQEIEYCCVNLGNKCYSLLLRNHANEKAIEKLRNFKINGVIEKYGTSIYHPHELIQRSNIIQIPCDSIFMPHLHRASLYADIQVRSYFNLWERTMHIKSHPFIQEIIKNRKCDFVIGVDSVHQLKDNWRWLHG